MRRSCWMTSKGPFQLELFYEYWYQVTFVKCPRSLELQKEQTWGQKSNPKSTLQGVLVEMTGKFNVFRFLGRSKSICFACPGKLEHNRMGYCQWAPRERERWPAEIFHEQLLLVFSCWIVRKQNLRRLIYYFKNMFSIKGFMLQVILHFKDIVCSLIMAVRTPKKVQQKVSAFSREQGKFLYFKKIICVWKHQNFESSTFLKPAERNGDCILYLNRQRDQASQTLLAAIMTTRATFFFPQEILKSWHFEGSEAILLICWFWEDFELHWADAKTDGHCLLEKWENIWLENVMLLFLLFFFFFQLNKLWKDFSSCHSSRKI